MYVYVYLHPRLLSDKRNNVCNCRKVLLSKMSSMDMQQIKNEMDTTKNQTISSYFCTFLGFLNVFAKGSKRKTV